MLISMPQAISFKVGFVQAMHFLQIHGRHHGDCLSC